MLKQGLNQKLLQKLSPQQIQFIQLLQLNITELEARLEEELADNPALEASETESERNEAASEDDYGDATSDDYDVDIADYMKDDDGNDSYYYSNDSDDEQRDIPFSSTKTLYNSLDEQLNTLSINEHQMALARHLVGMIEDDGYLRRPLKNVVYDLVFLNNIHTSEEELEQVLSLIQEFDPPGIGARDLEECLLIQLRRKKNRTPEIELAEKIVSKYLNQLGNKHYDKILKSLKIDKDELKEAIEIITHLNPKPGESQATAKAQYVIPDFIVSSQGGSLLVSLNAKNAPELRVSRNYQETFDSFQNDKAKNKELKKQVQFIKQKLDTAKWFIDAIKQRQNTLLQTMKTIVDLQRAFFESGDMSRMKPMILKDVADRINMDISTISRVASSKYVQTDYGIYSLKEFFSEGITREDGEEVSNIEVKERLKDMIDAEDKENPLTDDALTEMLKEKGYNIARRTVAKYREQLNLPVARLRKEL